MADLEEQRKALVDQIGDYWDALSEEEGDGEGGIVLGYVVLADVIKPDGERVFLHIDGAHDGVPLPDWIVNGFVSYYGEIFRHAVQDALRRAEEDE